MRRMATGLGLVEVLVALGVLGVVVAALLALQASSLRATRAALLTSHLAAAAEAEARLRSAVSAPGEGCLVAPRWPAVTACHVETSCADVACRVTLHAVTVRAADGREHVVVGAGPLEPVLAGAAGPSAEAAP